jgi:hypothetical protein
MSDKITWNPWTKADLDAVFEVTKGQYYWKSEIETMFDAGKFDSLTEKRTATAIYHKVKAQHNAKHTASGAAATSMRKAGIQKPQPKVHTSQQQKRKPDHRPNHKKMTPQAKEEKARSMLQQRAFTKTQIKNFVKIGPFLKVPVSAKIRPVAPSQTYGSVVVQAISAKIRPVAPSQTYSSVVVQAMQPAQDADIDSMERDNSPPPPNFPPPGYYATGTDNAYDDMFADCLGVAISSGSALVDTQKPTSEIDPMEEDLLHSTSSLDATQVSTNAYPDQIWTGQIHDSDNDIDKQIKTPEEQASLIFVDPMGQYMSDADESGFHSGDDDNASGLGSFDYESTTKEKYPLFNCNVDRWENEKYLTPVMSRPVTPVMLRPMETLCRINGQVVVITPAVIMRFLRVQNGPVQPADE